MDLRFTLPGGHDAAVLRLEGAWSADAVARAFELHRSAWFGHALQAEAERIGQMLQEERALSERWQGLPGTDHPSLWDGATDSLHRAQTHPRAGPRAAVWHPPLAWLMPVVRRGGGQLQARLPLADSREALLAMALQALPGGWQRRRVTVRLELETRVYWGARAGEDGLGWRPCRQRGDGMSQRLPLFELDGGQPVAGTLDDEDLAPRWHRQLGGGVGLLVAIPVISFERAEGWSDRAQAWWRRVWRRIGWVRRGDRDPTFVHRLEHDEPFWNAAADAPRLPDGRWQRALRDGAILRPASAPAARWQRGETGGTQAPSAHVVLVHGGLSCARSAFEALLPPRGAWPDGRSPVWPGLPLLDAVCTWRFEHDTFVPVQHNIVRLRRWIRSEVVRGQAHGRVVLMAHSRGGNVVRFALDALRADFPGWRFDAVTCGSPHLGTQVFSRIGRRWSGLGAVVGAVREMTQGWLGREQLMQLVILERGLSYEVPPGFHDVEPQGVARMAAGQPERLPEGLWMWGSEWGPGEARHGLEDELWDWLVEDLGGAEVGGDGLVARHSALGGREAPGEGVHDASPVFHTGYFAHAPTREQIARRLASLLGV